MRGHFLLQEIFPTQGSNPRLPHCRQMLYPLGHQGSPCYFSVTLVTFASSPGSAAVEENPRLSIQAPSRPAVWGQRPEARGAVRRHGERGCSWSAPPPPPWFPLGGPRAGRSCAAGPQGRPLSASRLSGPRSVSEVSRALFKPRAGPRPGNLCETVGGPALRSGVTAALSAPGNGLSPPVSGFRKGLGFPCFHSVQPRRRGQRAGLSRTCQHPRSRGILSGSLLSSPAQGVSSCLRTRRWARLHFHVFPLTSSALKLSGPSSQDTQGPRLLDDNGQKAILALILLQQPHLEARALKVAQLLERVD